MKKLFVLIIVILVPAIFSNAVRAQENSKNKPVFLVVEEMPEYSGGEDAFRKDLATTVKYPEDAKKEGISGKVYVTFVVNEEGKVEDAKIARGVHPSLDKEALRAVNQLKTWKPGKQRGQTVKVSFTAPINFSLDGKNPPETGDQKKEIDGEEVFFIVENMPEFPGGEDSLRVYISKHIKYPELAVKEGIQGKVYISFTVTSEGGVSQVEVARGASPLLDKEAIRVIKSLPEWKPGTQRGKAVNVRYTVPVNFLLGEGQSTKKE